MVVTVYLDVTNMDGLRERTISEIWPSEEMSKSVLAGDRVKFVSSVKGSKNLGEAIAVRVMRVNAPSLMSEHRCAFYWPLVKKGLNGPEATLAMREEVERRFPNNPMDQTMWSIVEMVFINDSE
jgi:hypothetical protein